MTIAHKDIPEAGLHEPKGASTASLGEVYQADGSGSGDWTLPVGNGVDTALDGMVLKANGSGEAIWTYLPAGWGLYQNSGSAQTFSNTYSKMLVNGSGSSTDESYLPREIRGITGLWDSAASKITPIAVGDSYVARLDIPVTSETGSPTDITIVIDIGGAATPTNTIVTRYIPAGKATPYTISVAFPFFTKTDFVNNGGQVFIKTDVDTATVTNPQIYLERVGAGDF
tara:strand:- start:34377 stop:35057 length:681 start_codon:yes stop_codon:yes gene_type:complete